MRMTVMQVLGSTSITRLPISALGKSIDALGVTLKRQKRGTEWPFDAKITQAIFAVNLSKIEEGHIQDAGSA